jgi:hypothetical protein
MELKSIIKTVIKEYPQDPELKVKFYTDLPIGIADKLQDETMPDLEKMIFFAKHIVSDWNFADENGVKLEVTEENIRILNVSIVTWIIEIATDLIKPDADKKKE